MVDINSNIIIFIFLNMIFMVFTKKKRKMYTFQTQRILPLVYLQFELFHTEQEYRASSVDLLGSVDGTC